LLIPEMDINGWFFRIFLILDNDFDKVNWVRRIH